MLTTPPNENPPQQTSSKAASSRHVTLSICTHRTCCDLTPAFTPRATDEPQLQTARRHVALEEWLPNLTGNDDHEGHSGPLSLRGHCSACREGRVDDLTPSQRDALKHWQLASHSSHRCQDPSLHTQGPRALPRPHWLWVVSTGAGLMVGKPG